MKNISKHSGVVLYDFSVTLKDSMLEITLRIINELAVQLYRTTLTNESLPIKLKQKFGYIENLSRFLRYKENFMVDVFRGEVVLLLNKMLDKIDDETDEKIGIRLEMFESEEIMKGQRVL